ncbi:hypothetical protein C8R44DRAFT_631540 [Mycena epipterygia]|nr:hypothetical protein C8R44DRAFT_631540 [Mycena epipterygia]
MGAATNSNSPKPNSNIVLITGANKGIGFEIAKQLALQYAGYHVLIGSRDAERGTQAASTLQKAGLSVEALTIDVTDDDSIAAAALRVECTFGRLDVLINNAGVTRGPFFGGTFGGSLGRARFEQTFAVNVFGAAATTEAFIPLLQKSASPRVVFVSSDLGSLALYTNTESGGRYHYVDAPAYRCSKAALNMLALSYAERFRGRGWKVNVYNPGFVATDFNMHTGPGTVEDGARGAVRLAVLGEDGETGTFSEEGGTVPW